MQYSVHSPSQFIYTHLDRLLPDWSRPVASVLVVLQPCGCDLLKRTPAAEVTKQRLRQQFLRFGQQVAGELRRQGHLAEVFDPRTGFPVFSRPGQLWLDDVAVARACLGYPIVNAADCTVIVHPVWGSAVYPSTLVSSARPEVVEQVVKTIRQVEKQA